jgi:hypothetical protein
MTWHGDPRAMNPDHEHIALIAGSAALGYVLSRATGLPHANGDIGNWTEPLGLASLFVEGSVVAVAGAAFLVTRRAPAGVPAPRRRPTPEGVHA